MSRSETFFLSQILFSEKSVKLNFLQRILSNYVAFIQIIQCCDLYTILFLQLSNEMKNCLSLKFVCFIYRFKHDKNYGFQ